MPRMRHRKHKVQHRRISSSSSVVLPHPTAVSVLLKHPGPIRKRIPDGRIKLLHDALEERTLRVGHGQDLVPAERRGEDG
jgi:hypothetical protein